MTVGYSVGNIHRTECKRIASRIEFPFRQHGKCMIFPCCFSFPYPKRAPKKTPQNRKPTAETVAFVRIRSTVPFDEDLPPRSPMASPWRSRRSYAMDRPIAFSDRSTIVPADPILGRIKRASGSNKKCRRSYPPTCRTTIPAPQR